MRGLSLYQRVTVPVPGLAVQFLDNRATKTAKNEAPEPSPQGLKTQ